MAHRQRSERNLYTEFGLPSRGAHIRILHLGNTANVPRTLSDAQTKMGHKVRVVAVREDHFRLEADEILSRSGPLGWNLAVRELQIDWADLDAIHIHGGIWRSQLYYYLLRRRTPQAAWVVHLHGSEARSGKGLHHLSLPDMLLCSTPDLRRFVPQCEWLPNPVPLPSEVPPFVPARRITFGHFPSDRRTKGTDLILKVLTDQFGPPGTVNHESTFVTRYSRAAFDFLLAEGIPHDEVLARIEECDAVIDHLSELGPVGLVSLEAMARGRAALSSYDPLAYPQGCPVIRLIPETAGSTVRAILDNPEGIRAAGANGRRYVEAHHQPEKVAARSIEIYKAIQRRRRT